MNDLRKHESTGRPVGAVSFLERLEPSLDHTLKPKKTGPKRKTSLGMVSLEFRVKRLREICIKIRNERSLADIVNITGVWLYQPSGSGTSYAIT
jgi:hypothetical protein